jgi:hypothetical protein
MQSGHRNLLRPPGQSQDMWKRLKRGYVQFKEDEPGERFVDAHDHWKEYSSGPVATVLIIVAGAVLMVGGLLLGLVPGVPGIVLGLLGFALIATRFRRIAIWLDWSEVRIRRAWQKCRRGVAHR